MLSVLGRRRTSQGLVNCDTSSRGLQFGDGDGQHLGMVGCPWVVGAPSGASPPHTIQPQFGSQVYPTFKTELKTSSAFLFSSVPSSVPSTPPGLYAIITCYPLTSSTGFRF